MHQVKNWKQRYQKQLTDCASSWEVNGRFGRYVWFWRLAHNQKRWYCTGMPNSLATSSWEVSIRMLRVKRLQLLPGMNFNTYRIKKLRLESRQNKTITNTKCNKEANKNRPKEKHTIKVMFYQNKGNHPSNFKEPIMWQNTRMLVTLTSTTHIQKSTNF